MFAKTKILTLSEFLHSTGHAMKEICAKNFLQVWWCGGSEEKERAKGEKREERREKGEERKESGEEGKKRGEARPEEKKRKRVKELKLD